MCVQPISSVFLHAPLWFGVAPPTNPMSALASPCNKVCSLDQATGLCRGCGRNLIEIERWLSFSEAERAHIMAELPRRLAAPQASGIAPRADAG